MAVKVLVVGDRFVLSDLIVDELEQQTPKGDLEIFTMDLGWPIEPFGKVAEVDEASGDEQELGEAAKDVEIIVTQVAAITERVISAAANLKLIVCTRGGPVNVNVGAASERDIAICYAPGRNAPAAAEYAVGLMLAAMKRIPEAHTNLSEGIWRGDFYAYEENGTELNGATVGLIGFGAVGARIAKVMRAFEAEVLVHDPFVEASRVEEAGARTVELDELLSGSNVVSLHARLTDETRGMIGPEQINKMPEGSILVNTARGGLLDYDALCEGLESGHLRAAALDVYDEEPPPEESRLYWTPGLILSPHLAGATRETAQRAARIAAEEVGRYVRGEKLVNVANPEIVSIKT